MLTVFFPIFWWNLTLSKLKTQLKSYWEHFFQEDKKITKTVTKNNIWPNLVGCSCTTYPFCCPHNLGLAIRVVVQDRSSNQGLNHGNNKSLSKTLPNQVNNIPLHLNFILVGSYFENSTRCRSFVLWRRQLLLCYPIFSIFSSS
jgi:hypothetical protein